MAYLASYTQQPADRLDYDIPCDLASGDSIASVDKTVTPSGLTVTAINDNPNVKVWVEDGTAGTTYKVEITITTTLGRVKQVELRFKIKDY